MKTEAKVGRTIQRDITHESWKVRCAWNWLPLLLCWLWPAVMNAQFTYTTTSGAITITGYSGSGGAVTIPGSINGLPVICIGVSAFASNPKLTSVTIPPTVTGFRSYAFMNCSNLTKVYCQGNAPTLGLSIFDNDKKATVYYLSGTTGWTSTLGGRPTALWNLGVPYTFLAANGTITLTRYTGAGGAVVIPDTIAGLPVVSIADSAFSSSGLTTVTIPASVSRLGAYVFSGCTSLTAAYFQGNAPSADPTVFSGDENVTVYHRPLTTGWDSWFAGRPTALYGQALDAFNPGADGAVFAMALQTDGKIVLGGAFSSLAGQPRNHLGRLNPDGTLEPGFAPNVDGDVLSLTVQEDGKILLGGGFGQLNGTPRRYLGRLNPDGTLDSAFAPEADGNVSRVALDRENRILVTGSFSRLNGQARSYLGRLNPDGTLDTAFAPLLDSTVTALAIQPDGKILLGGSFTNLAGRTCPYLGRLNPDGTPDLNFLGTADGPVNLLALQADGRIWVAGTFTTLSGMEARGLGRLSPDGSFEAGNPGINFPVHSLVIQANGNVLLGGGSPYQLGRISGLLYLDASFAPPADSSISCLALQPDGEILVGGNFQSLAGQPRGRLARLVDENLANHFLTYDGLNITWQRYGSSPMVSRTSFEVSTNGADWVRLGPGVHVPNGAQRAALGLPPQALIRAHGFLQGGLNAGSGWFVEERLVVNPPLSQFTYTTNDGTLTITRYTGSEGAVYVPSTIDGLPVTALGERAFEGATNLLCLSMAEGLLNIGADAFRACTSLTCLSLPTSLASLGPGAFDSCTSLTTVRIPDSVLVLGALTFHSCTSLASVSLPGNLTSIGASAFDSCTGLTSLSIPASVTHLGPSAFAGCSNLREVCFAGDAPSADSTVFSADAQATIYYRSETSGWGSTFAGRPTALWNPVVTAQPPANLVSCPGSSTLLTVAVNGKPPFAYQWRKNGLNLADTPACVGSITPQLRLSGLSEIDAANYDVVIANAAGRSTSAVTALTLSASPARVAPVVANGFVVGANVIDGGCGYTTSPTLTFTGPGGTGASAYAQISNGSITNVVVTSAGHGYPPETTLQVSPPLYPTLSLGSSQMTGPAATATPIVVNGFIIGATLTAPGAGYVTPPTVSFNDVSGSGAEGYAQISQGAVTGLVLSSAGSGYSPNATIHLSAPPAPTRFHLSARNLMVGQVYELQSSTNLLRWTPLQTFSPPSASWTLTNLWHGAEATNVLFFRLRLPQ